MRGATAIIIKGVMGDASERSERGTKALAALSAPYGEIAQSEKKAHAELRVLLPDSGAAYTNMEISRHINNGILRIIAKPNAPKTEVIGYDKSRNALRVAIAAVPDKDKANTELLKFLKRQTGRKCELTAGARSREKTIRFQDL